MKHKRTVNCFISALLAISLLPGLPPVTAAAKETDAVNMISHGSFERIFIMLANQRGQDNEK